MVWYLRYSVYEVSACASLTTSAVIIWFISVFKLQLNKVCFVASAWDINAAPVLHKHIRWAQYFREVCHVGECFEGFKRCHVKLNVRWFEMMSVVVVYSAKWLFDPPSPWLQENAKVLKMSSEVVKIPCLCRCLCDGDVHTSTSSWATETRRDRDTAEISSGGVLNALKDKGDMVRLEATQQHVAHMRKIDGRTNDLWNDNDFKACGRMAALFELSNGEFAEMSLDEPSK